MKIKRFFCVCAVIGALLLTACSNAEYDFDHLFPEAYHKVLSIANDQTTSLNFSDQTDSLALTVRILKGGSDPQLEAHASLVPMTPSELAEVDSTYCQVPAECYSLEGGEMDFSPGEKSLTASLKFDMVRLKALFAAGAGLSSQEVLALKLVSRDATVNKEKDRLFIRISYQEPTVVAVTVDPSKVLREVSPYLTGFNMSYYHDTDKLWADGWLTADLKGMKTRLLRFPGGNETSYYHWQYPGCPGYLDVWNPDHKAKIEETIKLEDTRKHDTPYMDTDEFIAQCRKVGAEPFLGVNILSGIQNNKEEASLQEAVEWVRYCKEKGYNVKYWYLDNEVNYSGAYGRTLYADDYAKYIERYAKAMRAVDPDIKLVANLMYNSLDDKKWLIDLAAPYFDILELHFYYGWDTATWDSWRTQLPMGDPQTYTSMINDLAAYIKQSRNPNIELASLEWNVRPSHNPTRPSDYQQMMMQAEMFQQFIEAGLRYACVWPLIWNTDKGYFPTIVDQQTLNHTPTFNLFNLYSEVLGQNEVASQSGDNTNLVQAFASPDGKKAWVVAINKSDHEIKARISMQGARLIESASAKVLTTADFAQDNSRVDDQKVELTADKTGGSVVVPPYSVYRVDMILQ